MKNTVSKVLLQSMLSEGTYETHIIAYEIHIGLEPNTQNRLRR